MKPKLITVLVMAVIVAAGMWLASKDKNKDHVYSPNANLAGEVAVSFVEGTKQKKLRPDYIPPDFYIIKENQHTQDNQAVRKGQQIFTLSELKGKYVFINFWNTWCPPCREEMPGLNQLYLNYGKKNVEFLFINIASQEKSEADVESFLINNNYSMPVYLDRQGEVASAYGVSGVPSTVIINPQGQVVYAAGGPITYDSAKSLLGY